MRGLMNDQLPSLASSADEHTVRLAKLSAVTPVLLDLLGAPSGPAPLLDLGCGIGEPTLTAARRWPAVIGLDQDGQALETARERARVQGLDNVEFRQGSFEHLPLEDASAAAAVSRFGLLLFGDGETGARELARVLAPGAPFALAMWTSPDDNPAIRLGFRTRERMQDSLGSGPAVPAPSRSIASASTLTSWLTNAGMRRVETTQFEWGAEFPDVDAAVDYLLESGGPLTGFYAALTDKQRDAVRAVQRELIREQETVSSSAVSLRSSCGIISGSL
jgi:ubiquinone/menaquinone biosynthesis C-methylase UbiE